MQPLVCMAYAMGLMVSPEALVLLGNTLGQSRLPLIIGGLVLAGSLHSVTAWLYGRYEDTAPTFPGEIPLLREAWGPVIATVLPLCARVVFTVCAATGILAIAGYVFNEVFVYWFPNLGFSFALLGGIVFLNVLHPRVAASVQLLAVTLVLGGILWLAGTALGSWGLPVAPQPPELAMPSLGMGSGLLAGLVLLMGAELGLFAPRSATHRLRAAGRHLGLALVVGALLFSVWGWASLTAVAPARLAESTVPHLVAARAILGTPGRTLMGLVVLAGAVSAVNALLGGSARLLAGMAQQALLPAWLAAGQARPALLLLAVGPAAMMGLGMAGEPETEVYTRAGILFWMLHYTASHLAVLYRPQPGLALGPGRTCLAWLSVCVLGSSMVGLLWREPEPHHLWLCLGSVGAVTTCLSFLWCGYRQHQCQRDTREVIRG